jgi:protein O-GlcNAc transferase
VDKQNLLHIQHIFSDAVRHFQAGRLDEAIACYRRAIELKPELPEAHANLGAALKEQGRLDEAVGCYRRAIELRPELPEAHANLGAALQEQGWLDDAIVCCRRAIALKPDFPLAHNNLGTVLMEQRRLDEAIDCYRRAIDLNPNFQNALTNLGTALQEQGLLDEAVGYYHRAIDVNPDLPSPHYFLGLLYDRLGEREGALACYRRALALKPDYAEARWAFAMNQIIPVYSVDEDPEDLRLEFAKELAELDRWFGSGTSDGFKAVANPHPFYLAYQEADNKALLARYGGLCQRLMTDWHQQQNFDAIQASSDGPIKLGIVSGHIFLHSVWTALIKGWMLHLDRSKFEVHVFYVGTVQDTETALARSLSASFVEGVHTLSQWTEEILGRSIEILVYPEIGMDRTTAKLANLRLAPVQAATWGHPETSGLPTIDYYISATGLEPEEADKHYTEKLIKLPHLGCCVQSTAITPVTPDLPSLGVASDVPLLLCPGTPYKYAPQYDCVIIEIARRVERCNLVFFVSPGTKHLSEKLKERLRQKFKNAGLEFDKFVRFVPVLGRGEFYGLMGRANVFLDTIGFSGFNTAMQAVDCGLPIVTKEGRFLRGRFASGILQVIGLSDLVTHSEEEYISLAVKLAHDDNYRQQIKGRMHNSLLLYDDLEPLRALEDFFTSARRPPPLVSS